LPNPAEPIRLGRELQERGVRLISISNGIPKVNPHYIRPYAIPLNGVPAPEEHPAETVSKIFRMTAGFQKTLPGLAVVGTAYSWLGAMAGHAAAAAVEDGDAAMVGMGRMAFAYPDFPRDLLERGILDPARVCTTCSRCTQLLRGGQNTGCALRDVGVYGRLYRRLNADVERFDRGR
jgi:2,4-dienoyl-CoA reductase (NADPH2)